MIKRFLRALWNTVTVVRGALANLLFLFFLVVVFLALRDRPDPLPERAALRLDLTGRVVDQQTRIAPGPLLFAADPADREMLLSDLIDSIELARRDDRIVALIMELDGLVSIGQSKTTELAEAIRRFREAGKPVAAVGDYFTQDQYRLAVEADTVAIHPAGAVALSGFAYYANYFAEALDKLSVTVNVFKAGDFKSIAEPFERRDMSPGERAISERWLSDLWSAYRSAVEDRRGLADGAIDELLSAYPDRLRQAGGDPARLALREGLVDEVLDRSQRRAYLRALVGASDDEGAYRGVDFEAYLDRARRRSLPEGQSAVAIVTAQGNMLPGTQDLGAIGGDSLAALLRETAERDEVEAIVLRVTSGGGSVFAAEIIREELERLRKEGVPIVVSMGSIAASGGYYIATAADRILATPVTLTGSIGVFAAFPTFEKLLARGGIYTDGVATTPVAGGLRPDRSLAEPIADALQQGVDATYEKFLALVAESRDLDRATLDTVAQGRTLSAREALESGLIDGLGSLDDATELAAELAGLAGDAYDVISITPAVSPRQLLLQQLSEVLGVIAPASTVTALLAPLVDPVGTAALEAARQSLAGQDPGHLYMRCLPCVEGL